MSTIGFIGLGIMGLPMSKNLLKAGHKLIVCDLNKVAVEELKQAGAEVGESPRDVASRADIIITMLPNSPQVKTVVLGKNGVIEGAKKGSIVVDMSSIAPLVSREVSVALAEKGIRMLDAPVSGGQPKAIDGTLSIMVGGEQADFDEIVPIFKAMGSSAVLTGAIGAGMATKAGVDPELVFKAIRGGLAGSTVLDAKAPLMLDRKFNPGFRINLHIKDLANVLETTIRSVSRCHYLLPLWRYCRRSRWTAWASSTMERLSGSTRSSPR